VAQRDREIRRKLRVLGYAAHIGSASQACRYFGVGRATFYRWQQALAKEGDAGLARKKPVARSHPRQAPPEVVEKVLYLRRTYHMGPIRIMWYLQRYHGIKLCDAGIYRILKRHGLNRLPRNVGRRAVHTARYAKQVPDHHIQVDVKFLSLKRSDGAAVRRFQYTAIDDATRVRP